MGLLKEIENVKFKRATGISHAPFEQAYPEEYGTTHLAFKVRYHMTQLLACLLELKSRDNNVCSILSNTLFQYKECIIQHDGDNNLKMFVKMSGEGKKVKKSNDKRKC